MRSLAMLLASAVVALPHAPMWLNIDFMTEFADYMLNDQDDLQMCVFGMLTPIGDGVQAENDLNRSRVDKNITEFIGSFSDLQDLFADIKPAVETCVPVKDDMKATHDAFKNISGVKELIKHVEANFVSDKKHLIINSLQEASQLCGSGDDDDWMQCGQDLGTALHLMLVAPYPKTLRSAKPQVHLPSFIDIDFVVNFADYLLDDTNDVETCIFSALMPVADVSDLVTDIKAAVKGRNATDLKAASAAVHALFETDLPSAMQTCDVTSEDAKAVMQTLAGVKSVKDLVKQMGKNFENDKEGLIPQELVSAFQSAAEDPPDTAGMGQHFGALLHRLIVTPKYPDEKSVTV